MTFKKANPLFKFTVTGKDENKIFLLTAFQ